MNPSEARAGIIGFGGMGRRHLKSYEKIGVKVVAVCDKKIDGSLDIMIPIYTSYENMVYQEELNILSVCTNTPTHIEIIEYVLDRGINHVLCEKPISTSLLEGENLRRYVSCRGARVAVNHIRRWNHSYRQLKKEIDAGIIGKLRHAYFQCGSVGLGNWAVHVFDLMRWFSGSEVSSVFGAIDKTGTINPRGREFNDPAGIGIVLFSDGFRLFVDTSEDTGVNPILILCGEYGRVIIDELNASWIVYARKHGPFRQEPFTKYTTGMAKYQFSVNEHDVVDMTSCALSELLSDEPISCTVEDGIKALEVVMAFHECESDKGNRPVSLPLRGSALERVVNFG